VRSKGSLPKPHAVQNGLEGGWITQSKSRNRNRIGLAEQEQPPDLTGRSMEKVRLADDGDEFKDMFGRCDVAAYRETLGAMALLVRGKGGL
jgi:hypothetical protein